MAEHKVDVIYHPTRIEVDDTDPTYLKHRGTVEVTGVAYTIEPNGRISFRIETDKQQRKLHKDSCEATKEIKTDRT
ncbi:MAG: hypothetical protein K2H85_00785, partial [Allobaculum sp.]|nr:hypothetical protein [Allobaculum sp.]